MCQLNYYEPFYRSQASSTLLLLSVDSLILSYIPVHLSILSREHQSYQRNILLLFFYISLIVCARVDFCSCMSLVNYRYSIVHTYNICILLFRRWRIRERQFCTLCPYFWTLLGVEKSRIVIIFSRLRSWPKNYFYVEWEALLTSASDTIPLAPRPALTSLRFRTESRLHWLCP